MELVLNLVWVLLATVIVRLWICHAPNHCVRKRTQVAALLLLLLVLFPVISVTDDLQAMQNPAESGAGPDPKSASACSVTPCSFV
jgi:hypothetical protein